MEDKTNFIEPLFERAEEFGKTSFELYKLKALDKTVEVTSTVVSKGLVLYVLSMVILLLNLGIALWLGDILGKVYYGFFCVAGFYVLVWSVLYFFIYDWIKKCISNSIISEMLN